MFECLFFFIFICQSLIVVYLLHFSVGVGKRVARKTGVPNVLVGQELDQLFSSPSVLKNPVPVWMLLGSI